MTYVEQYAAQVPALGVDGQERLQHAHVHLVGTGRVGSDVARGLAEAGIGKVSANDPQVVTGDNRNNFVFGQPEDVGTSKVFVLARHLRGREHFEFAPIPLAVASPEVDPYISRSDLVISCANTVVGRLVAEHKAVRHHKPVIQVAVFDGRERLGGSIQMCLPENEWSACFGCYLESVREPERGEGLVSTVTAVMAALTANMAVQLLSGVGAEVFRTKNLFFFDLETYTTEALAVNKRKGCTVCGK